jgi:hypothetical protein
MGLVTKIDKITGTDGGVEIKFEPVDINGENGLTNVSNGKIFTGILIEKNIHPKVGDDIELEPKFGHFVIKYNGIEIGEAK